MHTVRCISPLSVVCRCKLLSGWGNGVQPYRLCGLRRFICQLWWCGVDETPYNCQKFIDDDGLDVFLACFNVSIWFSFALESFCHISSASSDNLECWPLLASNSHHRCFFYIHSLHCLCFISVLLKMVLIILIN